MPYPAEYASKAYQFVPSPNDNYTLTSEGLLARTAKAGNEITSICFDNSHEILWTGNASGRVNAFTVENMKQVFSINEGRASIQYLDIYDDIVVTVTPNSVAGFRRTGQAFFRAHLPCFQNLKCIHRASSGQNIVFIGGKQNELIIFDLESQRDVRIISDENSQTSKFRSNHSNIFCANDRGVITIRSHTGEKLSEIQAHYGPITGFDICDNKLVTAGCTIKSEYNNPFGTPRSDPFLKVYDLRYMTMSSPINTPFPPQHVFFADSLNTGKIVLTSHFGRIWTTNINNNSSTNFVHELPIYAHIKYAALSSSHQTLAVVDDQQCGHIYTMYSPVRGCYGVVNYDSRPLNSNSHSYRSYDGYYDGVNSRDTSPANCQEYYNNLTMNDATYGMQSLSVSGNGGRAGGYPQQQQPKSRTLPDATFVLRNAVKGPLPIYSAEFFTEYEFRSEDLALPEWHQEESEKNIPKLYTVPSDKNRHDKFVYERFNNSTQVPLLSNSNAPIVNCVLRALSAVPLFKKAILSHLCKKTNCMLCEIQFVLRNIHLQEKNSTVAPVTCSAVIREMSAYRDFTIIKKIMPTAFSGLPMSLFCNFFFQHIYSDSQTHYSTPIGENEQFNKLMMVSQQSKEACGSCGSTEDFEKTRHIIHLNYSKFFESVENVPFVQLLEGSFEHERDNKFPTQCRKCYRMAPKRRISHNTVLPPVLTIDTDITKNGYAFWVAHADPFNDRPRNSMNDYDSRFVRDGSPHDWSQPNMFEHTVKNVSHAVHRGGHWRHYIPSMMSATIDPKDGKISFSVQISKQPNRKIYALCSAVMTVADINNPERYVAACKNQNPTNPLLNWTIFNDYIVSAVKEDEALFTSTKWKMPQLLFYCDIEHLNQTAEPIKIPKEVFNFSENCSRNTKDLCHPRAPPPDEGEIVALDSEFIRNEQNENVLGRVSCLNKEGNVVIDDYCLLGCNEKISDYLTQYSGIVQEDLDPSLSQKYLLSRKNTYLKVLYLVENKNVFVGHALHNDFKILNIYVPEEQIIDTCQLYRLEGKQFLSLRDLVKIVLGDDIQSHRHDSVEDALCALRLYNRFNDHKEKNSNVESWLQIIYDEAQRHSVFRQRYSPPSGTFSNVFIPNNSYLSSYMYSPS